MMRIVQYISARVEKFRWFKFNISKTNTQEVRVAGPFGIDAVPVKDMMAIFANTKMKGKGVVIGVLNTNNSAGAGEVRLYSLDVDLTEQTYLHIKANGKIEIAGVGDNAVRFSELETAFNQLKDDHDALLIDYLAHVHVVTGTLPAGPVAANASPPASGEVPSTADISPAKIDEIIVPS